MRFCDVVMTVLLIKAIVMKILIVVSAEDSDDGISCNIIQTNFINCIFKYDNYGIFGTGDGTGATYGNGGNGYDDSDNSLKWLMTIIVRVHGCNAFNEVVIVIMTVLKVIVARITIDNSVNELLRRLMKIVMVRVREAVAS